jgi:hypothetical protein
MKIFGSLILLIRIEVFTYGPLIRIAIHTREGPVYKYSAGENTATRSLIGWLVASFHSTLAVLPHDFEPHRSTPFLFVRS